MVVLMSAPSAMFVMAKEVEVELVRSELPKSVVEPKRFEAVELNAPVTVEEPVIAKADVVPLVNENAPPVIRPVLEIEKRVVVEKVPAPTLVVEPIAKRF